MEEEKRMRQKLKAENYLDKKPLHLEMLKWSAEDGKVTLEIEKA